MALADTLGGVCAFLNLPDGATTTATVESKTNFFRAVREGRVNGVTRPLHVGRSFIVVRSYGRRRAPRRAGHPDPGSPELRLAAAGLVRNRRA